MTDEGLDRGNIYRRRLARAAAASLALHMMFFGGLTVSRLDLAIERPSNTEAEDLHEKKRAIDFRLHVSRSPSTEKPAHERPLSMTLPAEAAKPTEARERPVERSVAEPRAPAAEATPSAAPSRPEFERSRLEEQPSPALAAAAPERVAKVTPTDSQVTPELEAAAVATESSSSPSAAPAATQARDRGDVGPVAARWRPREVALLEKLTATPLEAASLNARSAAESPAPSASSPLARRTATARTQSTTVPVEQLAQTPAPSRAPKQAVAPAARESARRPSAASATSQSRPVARPAELASRTAVTGSSPTVTSMTRSPGASGSTSGGASVRGSPGRASSVQAGSTSPRVSLAAAGSGSPPAASSGTGTGSGQLAPSASASGAGRAGRSASRGPALSGGARSVADEEGGNDIGGALAGRPGTEASAGSELGAYLGGGLSGGRDGRSGGGGAIAGGTGALGRDTRGLSASAGTGGLVAVAPTGAGGSGTGGGAPPTAGRGSGGSGDGLVPAPLSRGSRRGGLRSAMASRGSGGGGEGDATEDEEGLSVSPADIASLGAAMRKRGGGSPHARASRSLERVATTALPTDGRVRDVAKAFAGRRDEGRDEVGGISDRDTLDRARRMVDRGLDFLVRSQLPDGRWRLSDYAGVTPGDVPRLESDTAATGLALLCFLGAGHDHVSGDHRDTVRRGLEFLASSQRDDGDLFLPADDLSNSCSWLYSHGMASIAICEAVGMTGDPRLKPVAEKACRFIAESRHPTLGGWRYLPRSDADLSVSGWMLVALRAGDLAGVKTDPAALDGVRTLLSASISPSDPSRYAYNPRKPDQRRTDLSVACMTAVGGLMRLHTGETPKSPGVVATSQALASARPSYGTSRTKARDSYLWYYASQVLVHTDGPAWPAWYARLVDTLEAPQRADGALAGSWDPLGETPDRWGEYGGRMYVTTLHILALEVPWRHLPTYATAPAR